MDRTQEQVEPPESRRPLILEIKGNSLDDGPGIRTVVFFKGCPLSCAWCHNPESKRPGPEISFDPAECVGCDTCISVCDEKALDRANPCFIDRERCTLCYRCVEPCPAGAIARVGRYVDVEEVVAEVEKDLPFFRTSGGGVTLSGGEPTLYMEYASRLLMNLRRLGVHTIVETCGLFDFEDFERLAVPFLDVVYYDLKIMDPGAHRRYCGASNEIILENFQKLLGVTRGEDTEVLPRVPLIPGITDTDDNLSSIASFLRENGARTVALLQYNPLWLDKSRKIGEAGPARDHSWTTWMEQGEIERCHSVFHDFEIL